MKFVLLITQNINIWIYNYLFLIYVHTKVCIAFAVLSVASAAPTSVFFGTSPVLAQLATTAEAPASTAHATHVAAYTAPYTYAAAPYTYAAAAPYAYAPYTYAAGYAAPFAYNAAYSVSLKKKYVDLLVTYNKF